MEIKLLTFPADSPPLCVIVAAKVAGITLHSEASASVPTLDFSDGHKLHGTYALLRYIGRIATIPNFYGQNAYESAKGLVKDGKV
ncbi:hypothetical protein HS088_TW12G00034 [Tripterygium wilfordii]|uniref:GST N-terminal domain-containing protein n=1 Tax=Tripterygium wilfordii TaxID=458696 RepID=A0A7J7CXL5_TRIWF|nr:hypothetical protein HS088_TW12G00034 [Tripterygium wilfordii]